MIKSLDFMMNPDITSESTAQAFRSEVPGQCLAALVSENNSLKCDVTIADPTRSHNAHGTRLHPVSDAMRSTKPFPTSSVSATRRSPSSSACGILRITAAALGRSAPEFPAVQIAGTNGKGSTAAMLDSICREAGIRTGLFTSPHLISITERIRIDGEQISAADFAQVHHQVKTTAEQLVKQGSLATLANFF